RENRGGAFLENQNFSHGCIIHEGGENLNKGKISYIFGFFFFLCEPRTIIALQYFKQKSFYRI
ncbi:MAG: hypothetical protein ACPLPS_04280, partial [bacterium]